MLSAIDRGVDEVLEIIEKNPALEGRVVIGGQGITPISNEISNKYPGIAVFSGRADNAIGDLVTDYESGSLAGVYHSRDEVNLANFLNHPSLGAETTFRSEPKFVKSRIKPIEVTTGCSQQCSFCTISGEKITKKPLDTFIKEIEMMGLRQHDILLFIDHNLFNLPRDELKHLFHYINQKNILWAGEGTISQVAQDDELLLQMGRNCVSFLSGLEDLDANYEGSPAKQKLVREFDQILKAVRTNGLPVTWSMVLGLDSHNEETFLRIADFTNRYQLNVNLHLIQPRNGSNFQQQLENEGRMRQRDSRLRDSVRLVYEPKKMSYERALAGTIWLKQFVSRTAFKRLTNNFKIGGQRYAFGLYLIETLADGLSSQRMKLMYPELHTEIAWYENEYQRMGKRDGER